MNKLSLLLILFGLSISATISYCNETDKKSYNSNGRQGSSPQFFQTVVLLELSDYLLSSSPDTLSEDFVSELSVASGILDAFIQGAKREDRIWIVGYSADELNSSKVLGPFKPNSSELRTLEKLFSGTVQSPCLDCQKKIKDLIAAGFYPKSGANADGFQALTIARQVLTGSPIFGSSVNKISLVTSGLLNCQRTLKDVGQTFCKEHQVSGCETSRCEPILSHGAYDVNQLAYRELVEVLAPELSKLQIQVDTYLIGKRMLPHSLLFPNPDKKKRRCMTGEEINSSNYPNVLLKKFRFPMKDPNEIDFHQTIIERRKDSFFIAPNIHLSQLAKLTSGRFLPVRRRCPDVKYSGYRDISKDTDWGGIDDICAWHQAFSTYLDQPLSLPPGQSTIGFRFLLHSEELVESGVTDTEGRLLCEPRKLDISSWVKNEFFNYLKGVRPQPAFN